MKIFKTITNIADTLNKETGLPKANIINFVLGEESHISTKEVYRTGKLDMNKTYYNLAVGKVLDNYKNNKESRKYIK